MKMSDYWQAYKDTIYINCTNTDEQDYGLAYWKNHLFAIMVIYLMPLSLIAIIPGLYLAVIERLTFLVIADILAIISLITIAFLPGLTVYVRKLIFCTAFYLVSIALLFYLGTYGPGLMYLLAITIMVVLILDVKYAYGTVMLNTVVCYLIGVMIYYQIMADTMFWEYTIQSWIAVSSSLVFLSLLSVILIPKLFNGLQSTIQKQKELKEKLEENQVMLQSSIEEVKEKNKELEDFAYVTSHDLKEPLRMIRSFLKLLDEKYSAVLDEKAKIYIYFAVNGAERLTSQIDDLLEYSRIGRVYKNVENVDLNKIVQEIAELHVNNPTNIKPIIQYDSLPVIRAIPILMKMIFQNLIHNGLKFQPENSIAEIHINFVEQDEHWQFSISDNGIGIKEEHQDLIFQLFHRLHSPHSYSGTGMGLAICKKIAEQHGGKIWLESKPGHGSTFYFTIKKELSGQAF
jgi:signal transduction histidine kinase